MAAADGRSLEETPTWAVVVCFVLVAVTIIIEHIIHLLGKGKVPFVSSSGIHQLHIFIFVLAIFHVVCCLIWEILYELLEPISRPSLDECVSARLLIWSWLTRRRGTLSVYNRNIDRNRADLKQAHYKDIDKRYFDQLIQLKTTEMENKDLDRYYKALDKALMRFHTIKMEEINKIIRELWQQTYRGQDIDYISIHSDSDGAGTRSYNYKVLMQTCDAQLEMRGRCSAGQKARIHESLAYNFIFFLLNTLLQENRVLVGPEAGLTRDSIRVQFQYEGRNVFLVDTAGWLDRTKQDKGPSSLSIVQSRKHLMRAHVVALVLDAEEIAGARRSLKHAEVVIARRAVEEGRGLVVVVNKMDLLKGKKMYESVINSVPEEIQTVIPQVSGIPVVFVSALEGKGRLSVMRQVVDTYEKWCRRLPTARLNRWLRKVMSRHSWKDLSAQPKIKYFTQVKARPPTFVAFVSGKAQLSDTDLRFLTKSLKEDFDLGGIPVRIMQRIVPKRSESGKSVTSKNTRPAGKMSERMVSDKRRVVVVSPEDTITV